MNIIVYCRVSSKDQVDGTSLDSQASACREHAARNGWNVVRVFIEEGESAKFADRTELLGLMNFCKDKSQNIEALLVWKLDRFARNIEDHYMIKATLRRMGVKLLSVTEPLEADPNGKLMEAILAGFAQFDNDIRSLRTVQGMQQRLREGIFPWNPPLGYLPPKMGKKREPDRPDPERFALLQRAWRLLATGSYSRADILRLLRSWGVEGPQKRPLTFGTFETLLRNPFYSGVLRNPWTGEEHVGRHVPMVTRAEFAKVQELIRPSRTQTISLIHRDFPLRGLVLCACCSSPFTAAWSRGRAKRYAYYSCYNKGCKVFKKSLRAALVHAEFRSFLGDLSTGEHVARAIVSKILRLSNVHASAMSTADQKRQQMITRLEQRRVELIALRADKLISVEEFVLSRDRLNQQINALHANDKEILEPPLTQEEAGSLVEAFRTLPSLWSRFDPLQQRRFGKFLLPTGYDYQRLRTADRPLLLKAFWPSSGNNYDWVARATIDTNILVAQIREFLRIIAGVSEPKALAS